jgi:hypothetical protein
MLSAFQYFEVKPLSLAGLCYIMTMALLCSLYFIADRPAFFNDKDALYSVQSQYWISYELSDEIRAQDVQLNLYHVVSSLNMSSVSYMLHCDGKTCDLSFIPLNNEGKKVAFSALQKMWNLPY